MTQVLFTFICDLIIVTIVTKITCNYHQYDDRGMALAEVLFIEAVVAQTLEGRI